MLITTSYKVTESTNEEIVNRLAYLLGGSHARDEVYHHHRGSEGTAEEDCRDAVS